MSTNQQSESDKTKDKSDTKEFFIIYRKEIEQLTRESSYTIILWLIMRLYGIDNVIHLNVKVAAKYLSTTTVNVRRSLRRLIDIGVIERISDLEDPAGDVYRLKILVG